MDRVDFYLKQVVTEAELDGAFADALNALRRLRAEGGLAQGALSDMLKYGGILRGLKVTKVTSGSYANKAVQITAGVAVDDSSLSGNTESGGRFIPLDQTAYVALTNQGNTTVATPGTSSSPAVGDGSAITVAAGKERVVSLYIVADTYKSDPRTDGGGATVYFNQDLSYHFHIKAGTETSSPPTSAVTPPSLESGKVLLCDIILDENEEIKVISSVDAIINTTQDADAIARGPNDTAALEGRRSDLFAFDSGTSTTRAADLPNWKDYGVANDFWEALRAGNPREALYDLLKKLQSRTASTSSTSGADLIGVPTLTGSAASSPYDAAGALTISADSLADTIKTLLLRIDHRLAGGGGSTLKPVSGNHGFTFDPTTLDLDKAGVRLNATYDGSTTNNVLNLFLAGGAIPFLIGPHLYDDFNYKGTSSWTPSADLVWLQETSGSTVTLGIDSSQEGGVVTVSVGSPASGTGYGGIASNNGGVGQVKAGVSPFGTAFFVFKFDRTTNTKVRLGIQDVGVDYGVYCETDIGGTDLKLYVVDSAGNASTAVSVATGLTVDTWYTLIIQVTATNKARASLNFSGWVDSNTPTGTLATLPYYAFARIYNNDAGGTSTSKLSIDKIGFFKNGLPGHMVLT